MKVVLALLNTGPALSLLGVAVTGYVSRRDEGNLVQIYVCV